MVEKDFILFIFTSSFSEKQYKFSIYNSGMTFFFKINLNFKVSLNLKKSEVNDHSISKIMKVLKESWKLRMHYTM